MKFLVGYNGSDVAKSALAVARNYAKDLNAQVVVLTSMEGGGKEIYTDNYPLDRGKISLREGGTRVPLIITGPDVPAGVQTDVMANGLDFYPTILSLTGAARPAGKQFDGCDLSTLLTQNPSDASLIRHADGAVRDTMMWHFPNAKFESSIRIGDYKLVRNYNSKPELELYRLYQTTDGKQVRGDIEEAKNLANSMPEKVSAMNAKLTESLTEMDASYPYWNPHCPRNPKREREQVPAVTGESLQGGTALFTFKENGVNVVRADLLYTPNGGDSREEWFRAPAKILPGGKISAKLPKDATHYLINLIDENSFLVSYPDMEKPTRAHPASAKALAVSEAK